jgi:N-glycosylase/DNA lyase
VFSSETLAKVVIRLCPVVDERLRDSRRTRQLSEEDLWYELSLCLLSSRVPFPIAQAAAEEIRRKNLLLSFPASSQRLASLLNSPLTVEGRQVRYRFPNLRASQLHKNQALIQGAWGGITRFLLETTQQSAAGCRAELVSNVSGFGPKQASMFLRNIHRAEDLAILDSHFLRYLRGQGVISSEEPRTLTLYERIEERARKYAAEIGYSLECLDIAVWATMKAARTRKF